VIIVGKTAKKGKKNTDLVDDDLDELEELEELDDLDEDEDDEEPEDEDEDDDDDEEEDEDGDDLEDLNVKDLRAKARDLDIAVKGLKKDELIEAIRDAEESGDVADDDEDDEEDDDEEEEDAPPPKRRSKSKGSKSSSTTGKSSSGPSRSRTTDGKVGVQEVAEAAGTDARKLRMVLRKHGIEKDEDVGRYEWSSLNHPEVKKIIKLVKGGAVKAATKESLDNLKARKGKTSKSSKTKTSDTPRKKKSASSKRRSR
jgi:hypothetical protein